MALQKAEVGSDVFCVAPFTQIHLAAGGSIHPCCEAAHDLGEAVGHVARGDRLEDAWNSLPMRKLRQNMIAGRPSRACERCYHAESLGRRSLRLSLNEEFAHHEGVVGRTAPDGRLAELRVPFLDVRLSNLCNLKCRICGPRFSTRWYKDAIALGRLSAHQAQESNLASEASALWAEIRSLVPGLERLHFAGGEPLVIEEHYQLIEELLARGMTSVRLTYNTNFSTLTFGSHDAIQYWKHFPHVHIQASLDGMGARGDYMRKGQQWHQVVENRQRLLDECPHVEFRVHATVSMLNVLHIPDFYRDWLGRGFLQPGEMQLNLLYTPLYLNVQGLPAAMKDRVERSYRELISEDLSGEQHGITEQRVAVESVIRFMRETDHDQLDAFRLEMKALDLLRNERFEDTFPELSELVESGRGAAYLLAAASRLTIGDGGGALEEIRQALTAASSSMNAGDRRRAEAAIAAGRPAAALAAFSSAIGVEPALGPFLLKQWRVQRESGDMAAALDTMTQYIELQPEAILSYIDRKLAEPGEDGTIRLIPEGASANLGDLFGGQAAAYWARGVATRALGDSKRALDDFQHALELEPEAVLTARCRRDIGTVRPPGPS